MRPDWARQHERDLLRSARVSDVGAITDLVVAAFGKYVERIGRRPAPMTADYAELLLTSRVWVVEDGEDGFHRGFFAKRVGPIPTSRT